MDKTNYLATTPHFACFGKEAQWKEEGFNPFTDKTSDIVMMSKLFHVRLIEGRRVLASNRTGVLSDLITSRHFELEGDDQAYLTPEEQAALNKLEQRRMVLPVITSQIVPRERNEILVILPKMPKSPQIGLINTFRKMVMWSLRLHQIAFEQTPEMIRTPSMTVHFHEMDVQNEERTIEKMNQGKYQVVYDLVSEVGLIDEEALAAVNRLRLAAPDFEPTSNLVSFESHAHKMVALFSQDKYLRSPEFLKLFDFLMSHEPLVQKEPTYYVHDLDEALARRGVGVDPSGLVRNFSLPRGYYAEFMMGRKEFYPYESHAMDYVYARIEEQKQRLEAEIDTIHASRERDAEAYRQKNAEYEEAIRQVDAAHVPTLDKILQACDEKEALYNHKFEELDKLHKFEKAYGAVVDDILPF